MKQGPEKLTGVQLRPVFSILVRFQAALTIAAAVGLQSSSAETGSSCDLQPKALAIAERIRGLKSTKNIPCDLRSREEIGNFVSENIKIKLPKEKLKREEIVYKAIGLIPEKYAYEDGVIDLYMSQIGGYYDPDTGRFVMANWIPSEMQLGVAVHELTHAIQDQKFVLNKIMDPTLENGDEVLARAALVEGDASAVMLDFATQNPGSEPSGFRRNIEPVVSAQLGAIKKPSGEDEAPIAIQMIVLFPYISGLRFVDEISKRGGYPAVDRAFVKLPRTSEEILHPEIYLRGEPSFVAFGQSDLSKFHSGLGLPQGVVPVYTDTIGEFPITAMLSDVLSDSTRAEKAAQGWGGDLLGLYDVEEEKTSFLIVWRSRWDSSADAEEFYEAYRDSLRVGAGTKATFDDWTRISKNRSAKIVRSDNDVIVLAKLSRKLSY